MFHRFCHLLKFSKLRHSGLQHKSNLLRLSHFRKLEFCCPQDRDWETYNVGSNCEKTNLEVIEEICTALKLEPSACIEFVKDRAGHDLRYAIDSRKIKKELNWKPSHSFKSGIKKTIAYYA